MTHCFKLAAVFVLLSPIAFGQSSGKTRTYYIAADEVDWDYAPGGINKMMGMNFEGYCRHFIRTGHTASAPYTAKRFIASTRMTPSLISSPPF